jgi:hypothetical protein
MDCDEADITTLGRLKFIASVSAMRSSMLFVLVFAQVSQRV